MQGISQTVKTYVHYLSSGTNKNLTCLNNPFNIFLVHLLALYHKQRPNSYNCVFILLYLIKCNNYNATELHCKPGHV